VAGEFSAIDRIRRLLPEPPPGETWIGDDAAAVRTPDGRWLLLATDLVVEGIDFRPDVDPAWVGWKALVINVSDIAAMGGRPAHALVAIAGPPATDLDRIYIGLAEASRTYHCPVVGGDLSNADQLVVSVAITGTITGGGDPVLRSGARPGDAIFVTGPLGGAAASGYTDRPAARVAEGEAARVAGATAMIDVSDGLAGDLGHILDASGVGAVLDRVPVAPGATEEQALAGGEDFELLFTGPPDLGLGIRIGTCTDDVAQRPAAAGWQHHFR
jgi:thiamine-monophosphate kinase